jgi:hypothetical protein
MKMNDIRDPYFMALLCDAFDVYNVGTFLEFLTQSPTEIGEKFHLNTFVRRRYPISKCISMAKFITESDYSPLPNGVPSHPTLHPTIPDTASTMQKFNLAEYCFEYVRNRDAMGIEIATVAAKKRAALEKLRSHIITVGRRLHTNKVRDDGSDDDGSSTNDGACILCMDNKVNVGFGPCGHVGHVCVCEKCFPASKLERCPICRSHIAQTLPLYFIYMYCF